MDDPVLVEAEEDDFWFRGFNMRTGERGVFPAFYAHAVPGPAKDLLGEVPSPRDSLSPSLHRPSACSRPLMTPPSPPGSKRSPCWVERFDVQFLGSVEVPCHQGNGILCAAMQKVSLESAVHRNPVGWPSRPLATEGSDGALGASGSRGPGSDSEACADRRGTELGWSVPPSHPQSNSACSALSALVPALRVYWV